MINQDKIKQGIKDIEHFKQTHRGIIDKYDKILDILYCLNSQDGCDHNFELIQTINSWGFFKCGHCSKTIEKQY